MWPFLYYGHFPLANAVDCQRFIAFLPTSAMLWFCIIWWCGWNDVLLTVSDSSLPTKELSRYSLSCHSFVSLAHWEAGRMRQSEIGPSFSLVLSGREQSIAAHLFSPGKNKGTTTTLHWMLLLQQGGTLKRYEDEKNAGAVSFVPKTLAVRQDLR